MEKENALKAWEKGICENCGGNIPGLLRGNGLGARENCPYGGIECKETEPARWLGEWEMPKN